jgi:D-sedoheptulose 7-phosphate isomerase
MKNIIKISSKLFKKNISDHKKLLVTHNSIILKKAIELSKLSINSINNGGKIIIFGNGGSAADAQHFATELVVKMKYYRKALPVLALTTDTSTLTAIGNDFNFSKIFSRQLEALGNKSDLVISITTSGNSENILEALKFAKKKNIKSFGILGNNGGNAKKYCFDKFVVKNSNPSRIQEIHIIFWQLVCEIIEEYYL